MAPQPLPVPSVSPTPAVPAALLHLSPSRASDFKQCPQLYKYRSIDRIEEPITVHQARGTTAHLALQRLFDLPAADRSPDRLYELFREAWTELRSVAGYDLLFDSVETERAWGLESLGLLANYFSVEDPVSFEPLDRELDMVEELDGMRIRGILDRIDRLPDGKMVITDYKTGKAPPEHFARAAFFALKVYALLIRRRTGETPSELRLLYLNGPTLYRMEVDDRRLDGVDGQLRALWRAIDRAIERDDFPATPNRLCNWCSFQSLCPAFSPAPAADQAGVTDLDERQAV
jgi:putative RecB family exonuclease